MRLHRYHLLNLCDQYLNNEISESDIRKFAYETSFSPTLVWTDPLITDILVEWLPRNTNYQINVATIIFCKNRLLVGQTEKVLCTN